MADKPDLERAYALETTEDNKRFYRDWAETYDAVFVAETSYQLPDLVAQTFVDQGGGWPVLDAGCGTGVLGERLPRGAVIDGVDLSAEMLDVAQSKGRYRRLIEADLKAPLPLETGIYSGLISAGTFTHGHVGPEAFHELFRVLARGALGVISVKPEVWERYGFDEALEAHGQDGVIVDVEVRHVPVYRDPDMAPVGHGDDAGLIVSFRRR